MADYEAISKVIRNAIRKEVDKQIDAAYRRGYADGKARIEPTKAEKEQVYNHGLDAAWECARKIYNSLPEDLGDIFDCGSITMRELLEDSPSYVVTKIKEYEEKQAEKHCENCECFGDITIDQAIYNIKRGYGIPHKHKTLTLAIKALRMMKGEADGK